VCVLSAYSLRTFKNLDLESLYNNFWSFDLPDKVTGVHISEFKKSIMF
jgi:hypothetical protein